MNNIKGLSENKHSKRLFYGLVLFAVVSLIFAGVFAFLVAMARTPFIQSIFPSTDYVRVALVAHVNLAFVIWFLAFEGALWLLGSTDFLSTGVFSPILGWAGLAASVCGTAVIIAASLLGLGTPLFINYVPVLNHPAFYAGLLLLAAGMLILLANVFLTVFYGIKGNGYRGSTALVRFGMIASSIAVFVAFMCFALSFYFKTSSGAGIGTADLETLFWGGGHMLQFANTMAMASVWLYLADVLFKKISIQAALGRPVFGLYLASVAFAPFAYLFYDVDTMGYRTVFTRLMQFGLGPSTVIFAAVVVASASPGRTSGLYEGIKKLPWRSPEFASLAMSIVLFALGGLMSMFIHGYNTKIPSHYHGAIGGVTAAFMGMAYHLIRNLKGTLYSEKAASIQPYVFGIGQTLFVLGMFWAGSHGVARKTFGAAQNLDDPIKLLSMAVFGLGGLVAIIGGAMFVANAGLSLLRRKALAEPPGEAA
ncbi:MAG: cbb3-type cytochrome c oxidase subunit I [Deltaproteobacteria bacterium]